jgi:DNA-binding transcriptional MerR regulator
VDKGGIAMLVNLLTITDIAKKLNVPESTLRYYRDRFAECIPAVGNGRTRKYPDGATEMFTLILEQSRAGAERRDIEAALQSMREELTTSGRADEVRENGVETHRVYEEIYATYQEIKTMLVESAATALDKNSYLQDNVQEQLLALLEEVRAIYEEMSATRETLNTLSAEVALLAKQIMDQRDRELMGQLRNRKPHKWFVK